MADINNEISFLEIFKNFHHFVSLPCDYVPSEVKVVVFAHFVYHFKEVDILNAKKFFCEYEEYFVSEFNSDLKLLREYLSFTDTCDEMKLLKETKGTLLWKISNVEPFDFSLDAMKVENTSLLLVGGTGKFIPLIVSMYFPNFLKNCGAKKRKAIGDEVVQPSSTTLFKKVMTGLNIPVKRLVLINDCDNLSYLTSLYIEDNDIWSLYYVKSSSTEVYCTQGQMNESSAPTDTKSHRLLERRDHTLMPHALKAFSGGVVLGAGNVLEKLGSEPKKLTFPSSYISCFDVNPKGNLIGGCFGKTIFLYDTDVSESATPLQETEDYESNINEYFSSLCISEKENGVSYIGSTLGVIRSWDMRIKSVSTPFSKLPRSACIINLTVSGNYIAQISRTQDINSNLVYILDERFPKEPIHHFISNSPVSGSFLRGNFFGIAYGNTVTAWNLLDVSSPCNTHVIEGYTITDCKPSTSLDSLVCNVL
jgi:hypothetical protein